MLHMSSNVNHWFFRPDHWIMSPATHYGVKTLNSLDAKLNWLTSVAISSFCTYILTDMSHFVGMTLQAWSQRSTLLPSLYKWYRCSFVKQVSYSIRKQWVQNILNQFEWELQPQPNLNLVPMNSSVSGSIFLQATWSTRLRSAVSWWVWRNRSQQLRDRTWWAICRHLS